MGFLALMILFLAFVRCGRVHRMRRWHGAYAFDCRGSRHWRPLHYAPPAPAPRESTFEALKRRYVKGEISDYQYEAELDQLLRTPEGRREIP